MDFATAVATAASVVTVVAAVWQGVRVAQRRHRVPAKGKAIVRRSVYDEPHLDELRTWRLFDIERDISVDDVYVNEMLDQAFRATPFGSEQIRRTATERDAFVAATTAVTHAPALIEGGAGAGKSTMMRNWALRLIARAKEDSPIPMYVALRHFSLSDPVVDAETEILEAVLRATLRSVPRLSKEASTRCAGRISELRTAQTANRTARRRRPSWWPSKRVTPKAPEWVFLFDGLDEVSPALRQSFLSWAVTLPSGVNAVITTRRLPDIVSVGGTRYEICDFNIGQVDQFVAKWFHDNPAICAELQARIRQSDSLRRLCGVPLLLTCVCMDVEFHGVVNFPERMLEATILERVVEIMIEEWDAFREKRPVERVTIELGLRTLRDLALQKQRVAAKITHQELMACANLHAQTMAVPSSAVAEFVDALTSAGRLLIGDRHEGYHFGHALFFEFFSRRVSAISWRAAMTIPSLDNLLSTFWSDPEVAISFRLAFESTNGVQRLFERVLRTLPTNLGTVTYKGPVSERVVVMFAHDEDNAEARWNETAIMVVLANSGAIPIFATEGAVGLLNLSAWRSFASRSVTRRVAGALMKQFSTLHPIEVAGMITQREMVIWGIEDPDLYNEGVRKYRSSAPDYHDFISARVKVLAQNIINLMAQTKAFVIGVAVSDFTFDHISGPLEQNGPSVVGVRATNGRTWQHGMHVAHLRDREPYSENEARLWELFDDWKRPRGKTYR